MQGLTGSTLTWSELDSIRFWRSSSVLEEEAAFAMKNRQRNNWNVVKRRLSKSFFLYLKLLIKLLINYVKLFCLPPFFSDSWPVFRWPDPGTRKIRIRHTLLCSFEWTVIATFFLKEMSDHAPTCTALRRVRPLWTCSSRSTLTGTWPSAGTRSPPTSSSRYRFLRDIILDATVPRLFKTWFSSFQHSNVTPYILFIDYPVPCISFKASRGHDKNSSDSAVS